MPYDAGYTVIVNECWPNGKSRYIKWSDGEECWYNEDGEYHNYNGPAIIYPYIHVNKPEYWLNRKSYPNID